MTRIRSCWSRACNNLERVVEKFASQPVEPRSVPISRPAFTNLSSQIKGQRMEANDITLAE
jgi:hypothetical protein